MRFRFDFDIVRKWNAHTLFLIYSFNPFRFDSTCRLIVRVRLDPYRECFANDVRRWYRMILQFAMRSFHNNSLVV